MKSSEAKAIEKCQKSDGLTLMGMDKLLNKQYSVEGSPTVLINGMLYSGGRSSEDLKQAICKTFDKQPAECQKTLSSAGTSSTAACGS